MLGAGRWALGAWAGAGVPRQPYEPFVHRNTSLSGTRPIFFSRKGLWNSVSLPFRGQGIGFRPQRVRLTRTSRVSSTCRRVSGFGAPWTLGLEVGGGGGWGGGENSR